MALPLIYNPASGGGRGVEMCRRAREALEGVGVAVEPVHTSGPGGARPLAESLAAAGHGRVLAVGGDGTISEVCEGVLASGRDVELGFLPGGTGNSFLLDFGLATLDAAAARIVAGKPRRIDVARVEHPGGVRHFVNVLHAAFSAQVGERANRRFKWMGSAGYSAAVLASVALLRSPVTRLVVDGETIEEPLALVAVANTIHTGGDMKIAPMAKPDDGRLEVIALRKVGRIGLLRLFPKIFDGSHVGHPKVLHRQASTIEIEPATPSPLLFDGEVHGATPVRITTLPGKLRMLL